MRVPHPHRFQSHITRHQDTLRVLLSCPDRPGIVATVSRFFFEREGNIVDLQEYTTKPRGGLLLMRVEVEMPGLKERAAGLEHDFAILGAEWEMHWRFERPSRLKRMAIFVSKADHCLLELLYQWRAGDLVAEIPMIISNHEDCRSLADVHGVPFHHIPIEPSPEAKLRAEQTQLTLLGHGPHAVDLIVLARYMQILSPEFVAHFPCRIINIHHSFLPAFVGSNPYARAYERGVKLIGATSHYVTEELDEGPIIEQDVERVNHRDRVEDLRRIGRDIERNVLARAVRWHLEDRILVHGKRTVIFGR